jgi:hypothetical protein
MPIGMGKGIRVMSINTARNPRRNAGEYRYSTGISLVLLMTKGINAQIMETP